MREATSASSSSRVVLTVPVCHTIWQIQAVEVSGQHASRFLLADAPRLECLGARRRIQAAAEQGCALCSPSRDRRVLWGVSGTRYGGKAQQHLDWMREGACRDSAPEVFFPHDGAGVALAQRVWHGCPVRAACLEHAIDNRIADGVWGGRSERARRRIVQSREAGMSFLPDRSRRQGCP